AKIAGLMPPSAVTLTAILFGNALIGGIGYVGGAIVAQSMMADAADEHEYLFGVRREGLFFAGLSFAYKAASGLGGFFAGVALDLIHFPAAARIGDNASLLSPAIETRLG